MNETSEPEFRAWLKRYHQRGRMLLIVCLPIGVILKLPYVWALCLLGIVVTSIQLQRMK
jgi:hypothetical protein